MTWTSAVGRSCKWLLYKIVHGLALTQISPNALTFIGLLINVVAALLFGYARPENQQRLFLYAGLVIIGAGIFAMVDGRVARATNQVTTFGGFFDSVIDRYSDVALFFGLLVYYARANRFFYAAVRGFRNPDKAELQRCSGSRSPRLANLTIRLATSSRTAKSESSIVRVAIALS